MSEQDSSEGTEKTFTQAEVDAIIKKRAERVAAEKYGDYSDLQAKAKRLEELETANASDLEKAVAAARKEGEASASESANRRLIAAEARALAAEARFRNPGLAIRALDLGSVGVGKDGEVDTAAIRSALDDLAKADPYLLDDGKTKAKVDESQGGGGGTPNRAQQGKDEAARRFGTKQQ